MHLQKRGRISRSGKMDLASPEIDSLTFLESAREGILIVQGGIRIYANSSLARITGFSVDELIGRPLGDIIIPKQRKQFLAEYKETAAGISAPVCEVFKIERKNGTTKEIIASYINIQYQGKPAILGIVHDVSERRHIAVENILRERAGVESPLSKNEKKLVKVLKTALEEFLEKDQ